MAQELTYFIKYWKSGNYLSHLLEMSDGVKVGVWVANFQDAKRFSTVNQAAEYMEANPMLGLTLNDFSVDSKWISQ